MPKNEPTKCNYYLPRVLVHYFRKWCKPGRDYSPKAAAGILLYMAQDADIQNFAEKMAYENNVEIAINKLQSKLADVIVDKKRQSILDKLSPAEQEVLVEIARKTAKQIKKKVD